MNVYEKEAIDNLLKNKIDKTKDIKKLALVTELPEAIDLYTMYYVVEEEGEWPGLKFTSQQDNSKVGYTITGAINKDIYTSTDGKNWTVWDGSNITLNKSESIYVWNKVNTLSTSSSNYLKFTMSGSIAASGNCDSMIDFSKLTSYCYSGMFKNCASLATTPNLPAITLADYCYHRMFQNANVAQAPKLPATTLAVGCYDGMFMDSIALTTAPELPAIILAENCYRDMFHSCSLLITAPVLPATTLAVGCYQNMFESCVSLTSAPDLPATTLAENCYSGMFSICSSLTNIKLYYTGNFSTTYFNRWVRNITTSGTLYYNGSDTTKGESAIPTNFTVQTF